MLKWKLEEISEEKNPLRIHVTEQNVNVINDVLEHDEKGRVAKIGMVIDFEQMVLWSDDTMGYGAGGTDRICSIR